MEEGGSGHPPNLIKDLPRAFAIIVALVLIATAASMFLRARAINWARIAARDYYTRVLSHGPLKAHKLYIRGDPTVSEELDHRFGEIRGYQIGYCNAQALGDPGFCEVLVSRTKVDTLETVYCSGERIGHINIRPVVRAAGALLDK